MTLQSACSAFAFQGQPPAILSPSMYGRGLAFRYVMTPQVWAISGEVGIGFDGRDADLSVTGAEVSLSKVIGAETVRLTITPPMPGERALEYVRLAQVSAPVEGVRRQYQCVTGTPTLVADLPTSPSGAYTRNVLMATAYVREGATSRAYSLGRSDVSISANLDARQVNVALRLVGTPVTGAGPDVELGRFAASGPIDPTTGNFVASLTSSDRAVSGALSGRFFGPRTMEVGAALSATVSDTPAAPGFSLAGAVYGGR